MIIKEAVLLHKYLNQYDLRYLGNRLKKRKTYEAKPSIILSTEPAIPSDILLVDDAI